MNKIEYIIVHHEAPPMVTNKPRFSVVNDLHKQQDFPISSMGFYCGYHYFIEKTGQVIQARKDDETGAHTKLWNEKSLGICLAGNFDFELPTKQQIEALTKLLKEKYALYAVPIVPHRKFASKDCYGKNLSDDWAANLIKEDQVKIIWILRKIIELYRLIIKKRMNKTLGSQIIFGNIDASTAPAQRIDYNGLLKVLHSGFLVAASGFITFLINNVAGIDIVPSSKTDEMLMMLLIVPLLKLGLTWLPNHEENQ